MSAIWKYELRLGTTRRLSLLAKEHGYELVPEELEAGDWQLSGAVAEIAIEAMTEYDLATRANRRQKKGKWNFGSISLEWDHNDLRVTTEGGPFGVGDRRVWETAVRSMIVSRKILGHTAPAGTVFKPEE